MSDSDVPLVDYRRLVLIGHGGQRLWTAVPATGCAAIHPAPTVAWHDWPAPFSLNIIIPCLRSNTITAIR